jgi:hypothetical protein
MPRRQITRHRPAFRRQSTARCMSSRAGSLTVRYPALYAQQPDRNSSRPYSDMKMANRWAHSGALVLALIAMALGTLPAVGADAQGRVSRPGTYEGYSSPV